MTSDAPNAGAEPTSEVEMHGGFIKPERGHMPTLFSLIIWWALLAIGVTVLVPYFTYVNTESSWTQPDTILFWSVVSVVSTAMGAMGYVLGYLKGGSAWNFLIPALPLFVVFGHELIGRSAGYDTRGVNVVLAVILFPLALMAVFLRTKARPDTPPPHPRGMTKMLDRMAFMTGNLWWGIAQLIAIFLILMRATVYETQVGPTMGNEAAYASYYNAWWFGLIFVVFFITLYCATMRKYPFRHSQIGWLTTHTGLLILIIGCMGMYWGTYSGFMTLLEGQSADAAGSASERMIRFGVPALGKEEEYLVEVDRHPEVSDVYQKIPAAFEHEGRTHRFDISIDKYYSQARFFRRVTRHTERPKDQRAAAGVQLKIVAPGASVERFLLEGTNHDVIDFPMMDLYVQTVPSMNLLKGYSHRYDPADKQRGELKVRTKAGASSLPIIPSTPGAKAIQGRGVEAASLDAGSGVTVRIDRYFDRWKPTREAGSTDSAPGKPQNPALEVTVQVGEASGRYLLLCNGQAFPLTRTGDIAKDNGLELEYDCIPELDLPESAMIFAFAPDETQWVVTVNKEGERTVKPLVVGKPYAFSRDAPLRITPTAAFADATYEEGIEPTEDRNAFRAVRVTVSHGSESKTEWIGFQPQTLRVGGQSVTVAYRPKERRFPFSISLLDFRQINYANSTKPKAFESNIVLRDDQNDLEVATLVDMNHPLNYGGYRFFNSSPIEDPESNRRGVRFAVGRNPGYWTIIAGSIVTFIGLILVLFFKSSFRRWESRLRQERTASETSTDTSPSALSPQGA